MFLAQGTEFFNPDAAAGLILSANPGIAQAAANSAAWYQGKRLLERAIAERLSFAFETTLGGQTITALLESALSAGIEVRIWFVGLANIDLHVARVRTRVAKGGHDIPEAKIRERYDRSRLNLIQLMPRLSDLRVYDNSEEADPDAGVAPEPKLLLHMAAGKIVKSCHLSATPQWAKPNSCGCDEVTTVMNLAGLWKYRLQRKLSPESHGLVSSPARWFCMRIMG